MSQTAALCRLKNTVYNCDLLTLPKIHNVSGNLTAVNNDADIPFSTNRVYFLYDVPTGSSRGGHAHYGLEQLIVAVSGAFEVMLDDGRQKRTVLLNRPDVGLHIVPGIWRELANFSGGSVCLVLASEKYSEEDYIRDYDEFLKWKNG